MRSHPKTLVFIYLVGAFVLGWLATEATSLAVYKVRPGLACSVLVGNADQCAFVALPSRVYGWPLGIREVTTGNNVPADLIRGIPELRPSYLPYGTPFAADWFLWSVFSLGVLIVLHMWFLNSRAQRIRP
jgi:asparagine N-glycosylation enzyme membrane subunit Stt3